MKKAAKLLLGIENAVLVVSFIVMTLSAFAQVVNRNLIGAGISWFEELARYCMVYMALLATEVGLRDGSQIAITAVVDKFKGVPRKLLTIFAKLVIIAFSSTVCVTSFTIIGKQIKSGQSSPALEIPMYVPYMALPISFGLIAAVQLVMLVLVIAEPAARGADADGIAAAEGGAA